MKSDTDCSPNHQRSESCSHPSGLDDAVLVGTSTPLRLAVPG